MDVQAAIQSLRRSKDVAWPSNANTSAFAFTLDQDSHLVNLRSEFHIPTKSQLRAESLSQTVSSASHGDSDASVYFCGNSLGLQPKLLSHYVDAYLSTWRSIAVGGHFTQLDDSPLVPYQDMAAECAAKSAHIVGAKPAEVVVMNTLTVNLHLMMAAFYRPQGHKRKILCEWRPFPSDYYAIESQIKWHGHDPKECMILLEPDNFQTESQHSTNYTISTSHVLSLISQHASELALILLPGIQYYTGQLLNIPTITAHARSLGITIGWDLAHAAGNVELSLHDWDVDFACWCTYKYLNAGAGSIAAAFVHERHGTVTDVGGLTGWYGGDKGVRFKMDNVFVPTPGAQGFQVSNPSAMDLSCLMASLDVFGKTRMQDLRDRSLLLTAYAEFLLTDIVRRSREQNNGGEQPFRVITPSDPMERGAQLSVLIREDLMDGVSRALEGNGIICDKRKPGCIRVAPVPMYNTFGDVWQFMDVFEKAVVPVRSQQQQGSTRGNDNAVQVRL